MSNTVPRERAEDDGVDYESGSRAFHFTTDDGDTVTLTSSSDTGDWSWVATGRRLRVAGFALVTGHWRGPGGVPLRHTRTPEPGDVYEPSVYVCAKDGSINGVGFTGSIGSARRSDNGRPLPEGAADRWRTIHRAIRYAVQGDAEAVKRARNASLEQYWQDAEKQVKALQDAMRGMIGMRE